MPVKPLPNYEVVPLRSDIVRVGIIQSRSKTADPDNPKKGFQENLDHMSRLIDFAQDFGNRPERMKDLITFHEFPISGWNAQHSREEQLNLAIDVPGPELETLGKKAREYNCYIMLGCWGKHEGWPGHYVNTGVIIDPNGEVILDAWKTRSPVPDDAYSFSVYDTLDKFVEMYGWDAVFPVVRTDIGNLAIQPEAGYPEFARTYAMKGAELLFRYYYAGRRRQADMAADCSINKIYGIHCNQAVYTSECHFDDHLAGGSACFDPNGKIIAEADSANECVVTVDIPMGSFRKTHSIPVIYTDLLMHDWQKYECKFPPNTALEGSWPSTKAESVAHFKKVARW